MSVYGFWHGDSIKSTGHRQDSKKREIKQILIFRSFFVLRIILDEGYAFLAWDSIHAFKTKTYHTARINRYMVCFGVWF